MKNKNISNSKFRNTGVLFELLVRQITSDTLAGTSNSPALGIMKKYFNAQTELGKELQLYRAFFETGKLTESKALHFIDLVVAQRKKLNERNLAREKYALVNEIGQSYPLKDFLSSKVPSYIIHASIYKTFASTLAENSSIEIANVHEIVDARFTLVEHLLGKTKKPEIARENELLHEFKQQSEDLRGLTIKLMIDKFNDKYSTLNDAQKMLLREYINNVSNTNSLGTYVKNEIPKLHDALIKSAARIKDKVTVIKINEVASQLNRIATKKVIRDQEVTAMMIALEILKELGA